MARPATISITPDGRSAVVSLETLNGIRSLLRANPRHTELLARLDRSATTGPAGGSTINLFQDPALAADLAGAITAQLPKPGGKASPLQQTMVGCSAILRLYRPPALKESAIHAWDCLCGERNSPADSECRVCRGTVANGRIVPATRADAATVVRRGPSALRPSENLSVQLPAPSPESVPVHVHEIAPPTGPLPLPFKIDSRVYLITAAVALTMAGLSLLYWSFLSSPMHLTTFLFPLFLVIGAMNNSVRTGRRSRRRSSWNRSGRRW